MSFGSWFRAEREKADLSLKDLATSIGISQAYWSRIERGLELAPKDFADYRGVRTARAEDHRPGFHRSPAAAA